MLIAAIDPGKTSGYCVLKPPLDLLTVGEGRDVWHILNDDIVKVCWGLPDEMVVEAFRLYPWRAKSLSWNDMPAAKSIGVIQAWCQERNVPYVELPAVAKRMFENGLLKAAGVYVRGKPHARDAVRLALYRAWYGYKYSDTPEVLQVMHRAFAG